VTLKNILANNDFKVIAKMDDVTAMFEKVCFLWFAKLL